VEQAQHESSAHQECPSPSAKSANSPAPTSRQRPNGQPSESETSPRRYPKPYSPCSTNTSPPRDQTSTPTAESRPPSNIRPNVIPQISNGGLADTPITHCGMQFDVVSAVFLALYGLTAESQCSWQLQPITRAKGPGANSTDASIDSPTQYSPRPEPPTWLIVNSASPSEASTDRKFSQHEHDGNEYAVLPVDSCLSVIIFSHNSAHPPRRVVTPGKLSEGRRRRALAVGWVPVRQGQRRVAVVGRGWSTCRSRCVCGRVSSGNGSPHVPLPGAKADASNVRHDTIVVPETMSPAQVRALAERKAQALVGDDDRVAFLHLHGSRPVGGEYGTEVEWRYSYQVIPPGGAATDTAG
jgi:hypothetical protein